MPPTDDQAQIAAFLQAKGVTRCPTVCVVPTHADVAEADRLAYRDYIAAKEAARLQKLKSAQLPAPGWPPSS